MYASYNFKIIKILIVCIKRTKTIIIIIIIIIIISSIATDYL
jgi:hypothetical protein